MTLTLIPHTPHLAHGMQSLFLWVLWTHQLLYTHHRIHYFSTLKESRSGMESACCWLRVKKVKRGADKMLSLHNKQQITKTGDYRVALIKLNHTTRIIRHTANKTQPLLT